VQKKFVFLTAILHLSRKFPTAIRTNMQRKARKLICRSNLSNVRTELKQVFI